MGRLLNDIPVRLMAVLILASAAHAQATTGGSATRATLLVREIGGEDTPALDSVAIGMTLAELRRVRATVRPMEISGWFEDIAGGKVYYKFTKRNVEGPMEFSTRGPGNPPDAPVVAVEFQKPAASDSASVAWMHGAIARMRKFSAPECSTFLAVGTIRVFIAAAQAPGGSVGATVWMSWRHDHGYTGVFHATSASLVHTYSGTRTPIDCARITTRAADLP